LCCCFCRALPRARKGAFLAGLCPAPARKLFEKSFLDLQKLLEMGIIKPRPLGKVTAVRLAERASLQGSAPHPTKNLFSKRFLELQKLLKMGVMYPPSHDEFTFPPPRRVAPSKENNAAAHSCEHSSRGIISLACPSDKVSGGNDFCKRYLKH